MKDVVFAFGDQGFGAYSCQISGGQISLEPSNAEPDGVLAPGFVDQHIHGGFGIDFMSASKADVVKWANRLAEIGYETFFPTTITFAVEDVKRALANLPEHPMIGGFHLEGPFISPVFPGAQPPTSIEAIPAGPSAWDEVLDDPRLRVITMAPEIPGSLGLIKRLAARGVHPGIGHTNATYAECAAAAEAGASHTTHTFNAMRGFHHREAGVAGFAMLRPDLPGELIYDRIHVCRESAELLLRCKGPDGVIAISDGTMAVGMAPGTEMTMWGLEVVVGDHQVRLKSGSLAGSAVTLLDVFQNLAADFGPETAIRCTSLNPRRCSKLTGPIRRWCRFDAEYHLLEVIDAELASS